MIKQETLKKMFEYLENIDNNYEKLIIKKDITETEKQLNILWSLTEEVWELSSDLRKSLKLSFNKNKVENFEFKNLEEEIIDVLLSTLFLAKAVWIKNLDEAIIRKIKKNNDRGY